MKKFLYLLLALAATGCSSDELTTDKSEQPLPGEDGGEVKMYTVSLDMKSLDGDLDISQEPLTKAGETNNLWWFQINSTPLAGGNSTPYAYGVFDKQENMTVKLAEGYTYDIYANLIKDGKNVLYAKYNSLYPYPISMAHFYENDDRFAQITNEFLLNTNKSLLICDPYTYMKADNTNGYDYTQYPFLDRFYGVVKGFVPVANGKIAINMYYMKMGYRVEVQPFETGNLVVNFLNWKDTIPAATTMQTIERDMQYSYSWSDIDIYGQDTTSFGQIKVNNMALGGINLTVDWISADGNRTTNIFNKGVTMQRLKRSVFKISLKQVEAHDSGVETKTEATVVTDGEAVNIEGNINEGQDTEITPGS